MQLLCPVYITNREFGKSYPDETQQYYVAHALTQRVAAQNKKWKNIADDLYEKITDNLLKKK